MTASPAVQNTAVDLQVRLVKALDELLPAMTADGGGAEIVSLINGVATLQLTGSCDICPSRKLSADRLKTRIKERVPDLTEVNIIYPELPSLFQIGMLKC